MHRKFVSFCGLIAATISLICAICDKPDMVKIIPKTKENGEKHENLNCLNITGSSKSKKCTSKLASASSLINLYSAKNK